MCVWCVRVLNVRVLHECVLTCLWLRVVGLREERLGVRGRRVVVTAEPHR